MPRPCRHADAVPERGAEESIVVGKLNHGRRIDYVLQEAATDVGGLFFVQAHTSYWFVRENGPVRRAG